MSKSTKLMLEAAAITKKQDELYSKAYNATCDDAKRFYDQADKLQKEKEDLFTKSAEADKEEQYKCDWKAFIK